MQIKFGFLCDDGRHLSGFEQDVMAQIVSAGHAVARIGSGVLRCDAALLRAEFDVAILRRLGPIGLTVAQMLHCAGVPTINRFPSLHVLYNKAAVSVVATSCGVPVPKTYYSDGKAIGNELSNLCAPLVLKELGDPPRRVALAATGLSKDSIQSIEWVGREMLIQEYVPHGSTLLKVYHAGGATVCTSQPSTVHAQSADEPSRVVESPGRVAELVEAVARGFDLDCFGLDVILSEGEYWIVDINDSPSFRLIPDRVTWLSTALIEVARRKLPEI